MCLQMSLFSSLKVTLYVSSGVFIFKSGGDFRCLQVSLFSSLGVTLVVSSGVFIFRSEGDFRCVFRCLYFQVWG